MAKKCQAGHKGCTCGLMCCGLTAEKIDEIRASVQAGRGRSMFDQDTSAFGPQCRCGVPRKPSGISRHVNDDGRCVIHPDRPPQPWTRGASR